MAKFKPFLLGAILGAGLVYASLQFHVVRSNDGFYVVSRAPQPSMGLAYVDIRNLSDEEMGTRPELARAMAAYTARKSAVAVNDPTTTERPGFVDSARSRLRESDDQWGSLRAPGKRRSDVLDAPIWNPFADESLEKSVDVPEPQPSQNLDDLWPNEVTPPVLPNLEASKSNATFDAFEQASPFADITDQLDQVQDLVADKARDTTDAIRNQARNQLETFTSSRSVTPFDYASERQPATPAKSPTGTRQGYSYRPITPARELPVYRQNSPRDSLNRRAREIYEQTRRRSMSPIDRMINRDQSRASSMIDELIGPEKARDGNAMTGRAPQRYQRGN